MYKTTKSVSSLGVSLLVAFFAFASVGASVSEAAAAKKDWTMMVFINGHNSLDEYGAMNINQMEKLGSNEKLNMVVQWASYGQPTKRLLVQKDNDTSRVTSPSVQEMPAVDMGDKTQLLNFVKWTHDNYPADHYFVIVWNHGSGWHLMGQQGLSARDISNDDITGHKITTEQLGEVMVQASQYIGRKIDIYGSDACLMGMVEIAQEMATAVNYFVGSQELEPGDGWPYDNFLTTWMQNYSTDPAFVAKTLTDEYGKHYQEAGDTTTTFSAYDMNEMPALLTKMSDLKTRLLASGNLKAVQDAAKSATRFYYNDYADLGDVLSKLRTSQINAEAAGELESLDLQLKKVVIANATEMRASGLSVWWPTSSYDYKKYITRYQGLKFDQATKWSDLMTALPK